MSDREAFEKWAKGLLDLQHIGPCYGDEATQCAFEAWQAAQAQAGDGEPVAVADNGVLNWIDGKQFDHESDLYTQPAVNQQLLDDSKWDELVIAAAVYANLFLEISETDVIEFGRKLRELIAAAQEQSK